MPAPYSGTATAGVPGIEGITNTSANGVRGIAQSGTGHSAVYGEANGAGAAVHGYASSGIAVGGISNGTAGYGVWATATNTGGGSATNTAVYGRAYHTGVYGQGAYYGVYGVADSVAAYAIYGHAPSGAGAGYFHGHMNVHNGNSTHTGTGSKTFKIDHPVDPENKFLLHAVVEAPDQRNLYNGVVTADGLGNADVKLPEYFEALNTDITYQLTAIGEPAPNLHVQHEVKGNEFTIAGARPNQKISWQVTGRRHDPTAMLVPFEPEQSKSKDEIGLYLSPEAYGLSEEKGIHHKMEQGLRALRAQHDAAVSNLNGP